MEEHWGGAPELPGSTCLEEWVAVSGGVSLRVLTWTPADEVAKTLSPVVFVPGWGSVFEGWRSLMAAWVAQRPVVYIESREKRALFLRAQEVPEKISPLKSSHKTLWTSSNFTALVRRSTFSHHHSDQPFLLMLCSRVLLRQGVQYSLLQIKNSKCRSGNACC